MPDEDVQQVEIVEPVEIAPNGNRLHGEGRRWVTVGYVILALGLILGLYLGFNNDSRLGQEIRERCRVSESTRAVLRQEHERKLQVLLDREKRQVAFINSGRQIHGITRQEVRQALQDTQNEISIEKAVVASVQPEPCPD